MKKNIKDIIITFGFMAILGIVFLVNMIKKDEQVSATERRKLAQFPTITMDSLFSGDTSEKFEEYAMDQFVARDSLRSLKSYFNINILRYKDNNKLFVKDEAIYKIEYPLNENNVKKSALKINEVYEKYLQGMNVYYAIIPDKNYYLDSDEYLKLDYTKLKDIVNNELKNIKYINIWDELTLKDYYKTDTHWKQENLIGVVEKIKAEMNLKYTQDVTFNNLGEFYGVYYGQLGLSLNPDSIYIATNDTIKNCITYNYENQKTGKVYDLDKLETSSDKYDVYLSGATPLIEVTNPNSKTDRELLLFRDSYGSSIAPLLIDNYSKITLADIRYIASSMLTNYINFENQDVLFLYSTLVLNQNILK